VPHRSISLQIWLLHSFAQEKSGPDRPRLGRVRDGERVLAQDDSAGYQELIADGFQARAKSERKAGPATRGECSGPRLAQQKGEPGAPGGSPASFSQTRFSKLAVFDARLNIRVRRIDEYAQRCGVGGRSRSQLHMAHELAGAL
jgi:hypothetical protein